MMLSEATKPSMLDMLDIFLILNLIKCIVCTRSAVITASQWRER